MASSPSPDSYDLVGYPGVLRRRWLIVLVLTLLGALAALAYVRTAPKTYVSITSVYVNVNAANANQLPGGRTAGAAVNMDNEAQIVQASSVAASAATAMHSKLTPLQLLKQVTVAVPANTTVLEISCSTGSSRGAATCAQAFATAYLKSRAATAQSKIAVQSRQLKALEIPLQKEEIKLRIEARSLPPASWRHAIIGAKLRDVGSQLDALASRISALGASVNYNPGYVMTTAVPPSSPSNPAPLLYLPSGLLAGLVIGLVAAVAVDRRDDRIHVPSDLERYLDLPVLLSLPQQELSPQGSLALPRSAAGRAFTELAEAVGAGLGHGDHVIVVATASPGRGGGVVAANLAATLARTRSDALLVCADLRDATTHRLLGVGDGPGLAEVLTGATTVVEVAAHSAEVARLQVLTPGMNTAAAPNYLDHDLGQRLMRELRGHARYVIIEIQAARDGADTFSLAEFADIAIVVAEVSSTRRSGVAYCVGRLDRMRTPVLGAAVLSAARRRRGWQPHPPEPRPRQPAAASASSRVRAADVPEAPRGAAMGDASLGERLPLEGATASAAPRDSGLAWVQDSGDRTPEGS